MKFSLSAVKTLLITLRKPLNYMLSNTKNESTTTRKPVQAGDYGQPAPKTETNKEAAKDTNTDGRKTLALWSH